MKDWDEKIMYALFGVLGTLIGFCVFMMALGGWRFVLVGHATQPWNGPASLFICLAIGGGWGLVSYKFRNREFGSGSSGLYHDQASAMVFTKRLMAIATCLAGLYFIWQLAKGL